MKKVCIVGYGAIAPIHAFALSKTDEAQFYAVCDINESRNKVAVDEYGVIAYTDFDQMLSDDNIDSVHICTPHYLHFEKIKKALFAGKDVVCEKPVTMTRDEFEKLLSLPNADKVCVVLQNRLNPCIVKFREIVNSGRLGKIKAARGVLTWFRDKSYYGNDTWRGKWDTEGGGVLINQAVHTLDFFPYIVGDTQSVKAQMCNFSLNDVIEVEDTFSAFLNMPEDVRGIFFATNAYGDNASPEFEVKLEKGTLCYKDTALFENGVQIAEDRSAEKGKSYWGNSHDILIRNYYEKNEYFSPFDVKNTMYTLFALYDSAKEGGKEIKL